MTASRKDPRFESLAVWRVAVRRLICAMNMSARLPQMAARVGQQDFYGLLSLLVYKRRRLQKSVDCRPSVGSDNTRCLIVRWEFR
jgi:hypothetical protein